MGVPGLFSSIVKNYNNTDDKERKIIKQSIDNDLPNHLYLDFNGAIYQVLRDDIKTEQTLIIHTIAYLETLCSIIPNLEFIYIAIDGVCPRAKMEQQRQRRFHSVCRKNRTNKINQEYGNELDKTSINKDIDTNMITPGTRFMHNLSEQIKETIREGGTNNIFKNKTIIFSDSSIPQEGEHKILQHIKEVQHLSINGTNKEQQLYGKEHNTIIYVRTIKDTINTLYYTHIKCICNK